MIDVQQINRKIQKEVQQGKSLFQISFGLDEETRLAILYDDFPIFTPYARVAAWFSDFFENSNGRDYLQCSNLDEQNQSVAKECWQRVFPDLTLSPESFKSQCWLVDNKEKGRTSHLWAGLKQCLDLPRDSRFSIAAYDAPPKYLELLLSAYQRGEASGTDFAEFVEAFESGVNPGAWHDKLYRACQEKFSDRANLGVYLQWSGGISGGESALELIDCADRVLLFCILTGVRSIRRLVISFILFPMAMLRLRWPSAEINLLP